MPQNYNTNYNINYNTKYLIENYGDRILKDFDDLFTRQFWNLTDLGNKYRFSRERARQIFKKLYGHGYSQIRSKKKAERNQEQALCSIYLPPRLESLLLKLEEEGLSIKKAPNSKFEVNGHTIRLYNASAVDYSGYGGKYFRAVFWNDDFDFGIVKGNEQFYIVPKNEFIFEPAFRRLVLYIRATPYRDNNKRKCRKKPRDIEQYREAWYLLKTEK